MLYDFRYKNRKDFYVCKLDTIINSLNKCVEDQKNVNKKNQIGGGSGSRSGSRILKEMILEMKKYLKRLESEMKKLDCMLET